MPYYNRPKMLRNCLQSVLKANEHHTNWHLAFGDDGSSVPGKPIVEEILKDHLDKIYFFESGVTLEEKLINGLKMGSYANMAIRDHEHKSQIGIILCDDDLLHPLYLKNLNDFFEQKKDIPYCYSKIELFNPNKGSQSIQLGRWNNCEGPINPVNNLDSSQVAWRLKCNFEYDAWFEEGTKHGDQPMILSTDALYFKNLYDKCGICYPTGFVSQYKAIHDAQMLWHNKGGRSKMLAYIQQLDWEAKNS